MKKKTTVTYFFLGANSKDGFYSLYDHFACGSDDTLHIIKGGPGTGKSTFMKRIGKAAEAHGLDVEYILCSGDPHSLDGVYIPALHMGWADGTSPHILEPRHFGIDGDYIDLGQFCRKEYLQASKSQIQTVTSAYRMCYQKAYMYLRAAGNLRPTFALEASAEVRIRSRARAKIQKELSPHSSSHSIPIKRFLTAISCLGSYIPIQTLNSLCSRICILDSHFELEALFFDEIKKEANRRQVFYIECLNPLNPEQTETIIIPDIGLCFSTDCPPDFLGKSRTIHLDSYVDQIDKTEYKQQEKFKQHLLEAALSQLSHAKQLHDELEQYYRPALDVNALDAYSQSVIHNLFQ